MYRIDDDQHWHYPPPHPHHPHLGPNFVVSPIGRGPKGPKGDPLKYSDMTEAEKNELAGRVGYVDVIADYQVYRKSIALDEVVNSVNPGFGPASSGSIHFVEVNGLNLPDNAFSVNQANGEISGLQITGGALGDEIVVRRLTFETQSQPDESLK